MYNRAILVGRLVADPEMRTTPNGVNVATFRIAVDRPFSKNAEKKADFITVVTWRQQAEFVCRYFSKGRAIGVEGSIQTRDYTDKEGVKRYIFEIISDRVFFVGDKSDNADKGEYTPSDEPEMYNSDFTPIDDTEDTPF